jgi:hypothetical protein
VGCDAPLILCDVGFHIVGRHSGLGNGSGRSRVGPQTKEHGARLGSVEEVRLLHLLRDRLHLLFEWWFVVFPLIQAAPTQTRDSFLLAYLASVAWNC